MVGLQYGPIRRAADDGPEAKSDGRTRTGSAPDAGLCVSDGARTETGGIGAYGADAPVAIFDALDRLHELRKCRRAQNNERRGSEHAHHGSHLSQGG